MDVDVAVVMPGVGSWMLAWPRNTREQYKNNVFGSMRSRQSNVLPLGDSRANPRLERGIRLEGLKALSVTFY